MAITIPTYCLIVKTGVLEKSKCPILNFTTARLGFQVISAGDDAEKGDPEI